MARITVVNDHPDFLSVMDEVLQHLGHDGTVLPGESVTIEEIAASRPELLIVDLRMASEVLNDGWGVVLGVRSHPELRDVPVVLCTADHNFLRSRSEEISALADVHPLRKPFGLNDVEELVERLLERRPPPDRPGRGSRKAAGASPADTTRSIPVA